ncbi:MAG TPA: cellulase family glycosylhydrolase [Saprospiraceae bacterium]|nr:cellulase family glycosylhydrolase [Saprospiraceae bacterium]
MKTINQIGKILFALFLIKGILCAQTTSAERQNMKLARGVNILGYDREFWKDYSNGRFKEKYFQSIRESGFATIRINLHPFRQMDNNYVINPKWLEILDWAIKKGLEAGLMVILDMHEFNAMADDPVAKKEMFLSVWRQLASRYKDQPNNVVFEILNEPNQKLTVQLWNEYLVDAINIIRKTNPRRTLIIGPGNWNGIESLPSLVLPREDKNIIVTVHFYHPMNFTHQGAPWSKNNKDLSGIQWTGTTEEKNLIKAKLKVAADWSKANDRPIFLGEFGSYDKADMASRAKYTAFVARTAEEFGFSWAYWQFDSDFIVYDINKEEWLTPIKNALIPTGPDYPLEDHTGFSPIYNRQNLGSWALQGNARWSVEQGEIVGQQDASEKKDSWLFTTDEWDDFALELEFLVPEKCNTGIGIRMPKDSVGDPDEHGYEVQISDLPQRKLTGSLLHHVDSKGNNHLHPNQWNHLGVKAEGDHIQVYLNGHKVLDEKVTGSKKGRIGLQVPKDPEFARQVVRFRNLMVKDLKPIKSFIPSSYPGRSFADASHTAGPQVIPGKVELALYDLGGEGVAYHDFESENRGSGGLNVNPRHQRPHATPYEWEFRKTEGVDISYTKDFADYNHTKNYYIPEVNQFYVGWTEDNEWLNYTIDVKVAGTYAIDALYANNDATILFDIDQKKSGSFKLPLNTGNFHSWNKAKIGTLTFTEPGLHLLTFHYNKGNNFAYFEFTLVK